MALKSINPEAALELLLGERENQLRQYKSPMGAENISLGRGAWMIGVFGSGQDSSQCGALKVFNKYVRWVATYLIGIYISSFLLENKVNSILKIVVNRLKMNRLVEPETRMMWITAEITDQIGQWADANVGRLSFSGSLNSGTTTQINHNISKATAALNEAYQHKSHSIPESFSNMLLDGLPTDILQALTAPRRSITPSNVEKALTGDEPTLLPFVKILDRYRVLGRSGWLTRRDDALLKLSMQASSRGTEGKVFEEVTAALLQKWGPRGITWRSSVDLIYPNNSKSPDEIDVLGISKEMTFIGECKANRLSEKNSSVGSNFDNVVLTKASSQVATRTSHWNTGWRPHLSKEAVADDVMGFVVTFSSYGGLLWNPNILQPKDPPTEFGIFPLYSLILAVSLLKTPTNLVHYFKFRLNLIDRGAKSFDELEYLLAFLSAQDEVSTEEKDNGTILFRQYELTDEGIWIDPRRYFDNENWKDQFFLQIWKDTRPVTPAVE